MAIFGKKRPNEEPPVVAPAVAEEAPAAENTEPLAMPLAPPPPAPEPKPAAAAVEAQGSKLIVGPNIRLTGSEITDCDTVIVEGRVEATVDGRVMQIAETGVFTGTVAIDMAEIRGHFQGELTVRKRLTVCGTGKVSGHIRYGTLVVEEGGQLSGDVDAIGSAQSAAPRRAASGEGGKAGQAALLEKTPGPPASGELPATGAGGPTPL